MQVAVALDGQELKKRLGVPVVPRLVDNQLVTGAHFEAPQKKHAQPGVDGLHVHTLRPTGRRSKMDPNAALYLLPPKTTPAYST